MDHRMNAAETLDIAQGLGHLAKFLESAGFREAAEFVEIAALSASDQVRETAMRAGNVQPFTGRRHGPTVISGGRDELRTRPEGARQHARHRAG